MSSITFTSAVLIYVIQWLIGLSAFGIAASAIFLYILGAAGAGAVGASVAISSICATLTISYLIMQSFNASQLRHRQWHGSWLAQACVQLPRIQIVCWLITTAVTLWKAVNLPLCQNTNADKSDEDAWHEGLGCWVFRVLVSLDVVILVLTFSLLIFLEIKGRHIPIGLFHFEHTPTPPRQRRHTLMASAYGESTENLHPTPEKPISPSPTYRTIESRRPSALPDEESILDLSTSRRSTCTTATLATLPMSTLSFPNLSTHPRLSKSSQISSRPLSNIPPVPTFSQKFADLERLEAEHLAATAAVGADLSPTKPRQIPLTSTESVSSVPKPDVYITNPASKIKSSCALPLDSSRYSLRPTNATGPRSSTMSFSAATAMASTTTLFTTPGPRSSTMTVPEAPAWCPALLQAPLSSDPAIKRLTNMKRGSTRTSRRMSFSAFEFGFHRKSTASMAHKRLASHASISRDVNEAMEEKENIRPKSMGNRKRSVSQSQPKAVPNTPPPIPERASTRMSGVTGTEQRMRGKSMVERGRFEASPR